MNRSRAVGIVALAAALWACGDDDSGTFTLPDAGPPYDAGSTKTDAGVDAGRDAATDAAMDAAADAAMDAAADAASSDAQAADAGAALGPMVSVMQPAATLDPLTGPVLTGASVQVVCKAIARSAQAPVDPTKVVVLVFTGTSTTTALEPIKANLSDTDTYKASVPLASLPTGRVRFRCAAADSTTAAATAFSEVETYYDAGPVITFTNLTNDSVVRLGSTPEIDLTIKFDVAPVPLADGDTAANVASVQLLVGDRMVPIDRQTGRSYEKDIDFKDFFDGGAIDQVKIEVIAANARGTMPTQVRKELNVKVDAVGPTVVVSAPDAPGGIPPIVGGTVRMQMTITDDRAGVAEGGDKLYVVVHTVVDPAAQTKTFPLERVGATDLYTFSFDSGFFSNTRDIAADIYAHDRADNQTKQAFPMRLDTVPPWISLDPPNVRVLTTTSPPQASASFDPLGVSPRDGEVVLQGARFRALIWERGIIIPGQTETWISGVRNNTVQFYAQDNASVPLLKDTDLDGVCDTINDAAELGVDVPFITSLSPVPTGGLLPSSSLLEQSVPPAVTGSYDPYISSQNEVRCIGSEMQYVIAHEMSGNPSAVYAHAPTASGLGCTGVSWDIGARGGWMCIAVAARDQAGPVGNLGVSAPIRVCRKLSGSDCGGAAAGSVLPVPENVRCTDGCTVPTLWSVGPGGFAGSGVILSQ